MSDANPSPSPPTPGRGERAYKEQVEEIFNQALERTEEERAKFVAEACGGDAELEERVRRLLEAYGRAGDILEEAVDPAVEVEIARLKPEEAGDQIGPYRLVEKLGEGGFGVVWKAEQERPVKRLVALKIIKVGMDTREVIARFEQERQALAVMDHPNIAKVHDAGATEFGRPYFVMELVRGIRITDYCDETKLSTRERLKLFIQVCQAVQHAHQKGIIHRDLKPSNILLMLQDGVPVPKVIDFGVAKAIHGPLSEATITTDVEQMIGTPLYMSPEQAGMSGVDVDTRSDIYSLGVVLYELLTGRTPFDRRDVAGAGYIEMRRMICESEAKKPSTALRAMAAGTAITVASLRQCDLSKLIHTLRGDLDWITMKAIEKDRTRRYATVNGLAADLQRYLVDEPVSATPPSAGYRFRKFARRHKLSLSAGAAVAAALVLGLVASLWQADRATREEIKALASQKKAEESERMTKRISNATDMNRVQEALRWNDVGLARQLLDRNRPKEGEEDLRGWEWRYFYNECRSGALETLSKGNGTPVSVARYSSSGKMLLVGYGNGELGLWDLATRTRRRVQVETGSPARAVFAPDDGSFAAAMGKGVVGIVDVKTADTKVLCKVRGAIRDLSYSHDGDWLAVLSNGPEELTVLRVADGNPVMAKPMSVRGGGTFFGNVRISPNKKRIYVSYGGLDTPKLQCLPVPGEDPDAGWEIPIGPIDEKEPQSGSDSGFSAMDLSPDGEFLVVATGYRDPRIRVLEAATGKLKASLEGHTKYVLQLVFSSDGRILASGSEDQTIRLWDTATWTRLSVPLRGHNLEVGAVTISRDSHFLASGDKDGEVMIWDLQVPQLPRGQRELPADIQNVVTLAGDRMVAGRTTSGEWSLIDLLTLRREPFPASELLADGKRPRIVPKEHRQLPSRFDAMLDLRPPLTKPAISPDGKLMVVGSDSGHVGFYDAITGKKLATERCNLGAIFGVAFSPDGKRLVLSSGGDRGIAIWDVIIRQEVAVLSSYGSLLSRVEFTGDGNTLLIGPKSTGGGRGHHYFWHAPSFEEIDAAERIGGRWPQPSAFSRLPRPPTLAELETQTEAEYRRILAGPQGPLPEDIERRNETLENLSELLLQQHRFADAAPFFQEFLERLKQRDPQDDKVVPELTKKLLRVILAQLQTEVADKEKGSFATLSGQADSLVNDMLGIYTRRSLKNPGDTYGSMRLAVFQLWFGRKDEHLATCRRMLEWAEQDPDNGDAQEHAAVAWLLHESDDPALLSRAVTLARNAVRLAKDQWQKAWYHRTLALAEYRSRNYAASEEALRRAEEAAEDFPERQRGFQRALRTSVRFIRAMILSRTGDVTKAGELFAQARAEMRPLPADHRELLGIPSAFDDALVWLSFKEASRLLKMEP